MNSHNIAVLVLQLVPFILMGLLLIFILGARSGRYPIYRWYRLAPPANVDIADQLQKLADLRKQGVLSEDEFQAAKKRVIQI